MKKNCIVLSRMHDILLSIENNDEWLRSPSCRNGTINATIYLSWRGIETDYQVTEAHEDIVFAFEI